MVLAMNIYAVIKEMVQISQQVTFVHFLNSHEAWAHESAQRQVCVDTHRALGFRCATTDKWTLSKWLISSLIISNHVTSNLISKCLLLLSLRLIFCPISCVFACLFLFLSQALELLQGLLQPVWLDSSCPLPFVHHSPHAQCTRLFALAGWGIGSSKLLDWISPLSAKVLFTLTKPKHFKIIRVHGLVSTNWCIYVCFADLRVLASMLWCFGRSWRHWSGLWCSSFTWC